MVEAGDVRPTGVTMGPEALFDNLLISIQVVLKIEQSACVDIPARRLAVPGAQKKS
jgi:hypothetical protein